MPLIELVDDTISQPAGRLTPVPNPAAPASPVSAASQAAFGIYPSSGINRRARSPQPGGSVLDNPAPPEQRGPANPYAAGPLSTSAGGPLIPEVRRAVESSWDAGTPEQRALLESADNFVGQVARERAQQFRAMDAARGANPATQGMGGVLDDADPRAEFRTSRIVLQGEDPQFAQTAGREGARLGVLPGKEIGALGGTLQPSPYDFDTAALFDPNKPGNGLNNPVVRGLVKAGAGIGKSYSGLFEFQADVMGLDTGAKAARQMGGQMRSTEEAIGERGDFLTRNFEGAVSSIVQQLPLLVGGAALGSKAIPLAGMAVQAFGQEYSDGKAKGQNAVQATYRASLMAALEVIGERFGLGQTMDALRAAARGAPTGEIGKLVLEALKREVPGELLTTTGQFAVDKFAGGGVGLNPTATFDDYLKQVADTIAQTLMQSGMMGAGTTGVSAGVRFLRNGGVNAGVAEADAERAKQQALARWAALSGGVQPQGAAGAPVPAGRVDPPLGRLVPLDDEAASPDGRIEPSLGADPAMPGAGAFPAFGAGAGGTAFPPANGLQGVVPGLSGATSPTPQADPMMRLAELQIVMQQRSLTPQEQAEFQRLTQQLDGEAAPPAGPAAPPVTTASASPWASTGAPLQQAPAPASILPPAAQGVIAPAAPTPDAASAGATPPVASTAQSGTYTVADAISADGPVEETVRLVVRPDGTSAILRGNGDLIDVTEMVRAGFSAERAIAQAMGHDTSGANVKAAPPVTTASASPWASTGAPLRQAPAPASILPPAAQGVLPPAAPAPDAATPGAPAPVGNVKLQPRDRSRTASVLQMQAIERNPDYGRLGVSRTPDSGAPMIFAVGDALDLIPARNFGREDFAVMADGTRVPFRYAVVDASLVQASHFTDGSVNPGFAATQPGTLKALTNGRAAGIRGSYGRGTAATYNAELTADAANHGVDVAAVALTPNAMLVRVYRDADNKPNMGDLSQGQGLGMSDVENAQQDADLLDDGVLGQWQGGDVTDARNREFVSSFVGKLYSAGQDVSRMMTDKGQLSLAGRRRIDAAMMAAAYGDADLIGEMFESNDTDIAAIGGALRQAAGQWAQLRSSIRADQVDAQFDVTDTLMQAVRIVREARRKRQALSEIIQQADLETGQPPGPLLVLALRLLYGGQNLTRARGREKLASMLLAYTEDARSAGSGGLFGNAGTALETLENVIAKEDPDAVQAPSNAQPASPSAGAPPGGNRGDRPAQGSGPGQDVGDDGQAGQRPGAAAPGAGDDRPGAGGAGPTVGAATPAVTPPAAAPTAGAAPAAPDAPALRIAGSEPQFEAQQVYNSLFDAMNGGLPAVADQELRARFADRQIAGPTGLLPAGQQLVRRLNEIGSSRDAQPVVDEVLGRRAWPQEAKPRGSKRPAAAQKPAPGAPASAPATPQGGFDVRQGQGQETPEALNAPAGGTTGTAPAAPPAAAPPTSPNTIFTEDAANAARERLRKKLGRLQSGIDPETMLDGITLAGYHIERGARRFAAYARAMVEDLGDAVKPYLVSWYLAVRNDPRAAGLKADMDRAADVEDVDLDAVLAQPDEAPAPAPAPPTTTPGTRLSWANVSEWIRAYQELQRRPPAANKYRQIDAHIAALTNDKIEGDKDAQALRALRALFDSDPQLKPSRGQREGSEYVRVLDAVDRALKRRGAPMQPRLDLGADPVQTLMGRMRRYASGLSAVGDLGAGGRAAGGAKLRGVGVDAGELSANGIETLANAVVDQKAALFIDSGAFGAFRRGLKSGASKPLDFDALLDTYQRILEAISVANEAELQAGSEYPVPLMVMPDIVGDQAGSIELVRQYRRWIAVEAQGNLMRPIVPIQVGDKTMAQAYAEIVDILGTDNFIVGVPSNERAVSPEQFTQFLRDAKPKAVHILGAASDRTLAPRLRSIIEAGMADTLEVTADASPIRSAIIRAVQQGAKRGQAIEDFLLEPDDAKPSPDAELDAGLRRNADDADVAAGLLADALVGEGHLSTEMRYIASVYLQQGKEAGLEALTTATQDPDSGFSLMDLDAKEMAAYVEDTHKFLAAKAEVFRSAAPAAPALQPGDRVRFVPNDMSPLGGGPVEGTVFTVDTTSGGALRVRLRLDEDAPQGGGKLERLVYSDRGVFELLNAPSGAPADPQLAKLLEEYDRLLERWNDLARRRSAATGQDQERLTRLMDQLRPELDLAKARAMSYQQRVAAGQIKLQRRKEAAAKYGAMPVGTRIGMIVHPDDDSLFWEKTGADEWTRRGMGGAETVTKTSAEMEGDRLIGAPTADPDDTAAQAAGFALKKGLTNEWGTKVEYGGERDRVALLYTLRRVGGTEALGPRRYALSVSPTFPGSGVTGAPGILVGLFDTIDVALAKFTDDSDIRQGKKVDPELVSVLSLMGLSDQEIAAMPNAQRIAMVREVEEKARAVQFVNAAPPRGASALYIGTGEDGAMYTLRSTRLVPTGEGSRVQDTYIRNLARDKDAAVFKARIYAAAGGADRVFWGAPDTLNAPQPGDRGGGAGRGPIIDNSVPDTPEAVLAGAGLQVRALTSARGKPYWAVTGDTRTHETLLDALGFGKPFKMGGKWHRSVFDADPTARLVEALRNGLPRQDQTAAGGEGGSTGAAPGGSTGAAPDAPPAPTDADRAAVKAARLEVTQDGATWTVTGKGTFDLKDTLKQLGGRWDGYRKAWTFGSDPTAGLAGALAQRAGGGDSADDAGSGASDSEDARRIAQRQREDARDDERADAGDVAQLVREDTKDLIRRGERFGIPRQIVDEQIEDVGLILNAHAKGKPLFILANEAGTGKTYVLGGAIKELRQRGETRFVYVTMNTDLIAQIQRDLADFGVKDVEFRTYSEMSTKDFDTDGAILIFDEAHNVKNVGAETARANKGQELIGRAKMTLFASATPFENPVEARYLQATGVFDSVGGFNEWAQMYGAAVKRRKFYNPRTGQEQVEEIIYWPGRGKKEDGAAARQWLFKQAVMTQRAMRIDPGMTDTTFRRAAVEPKWVALYDRVVAAYEAALGAWTTEDGIPRDAKIVAEISRHRENTVKRILEASKIPFAIDEAQKLLAAGRNVVIFVETKAERQLGQWKRSEHFKDDRLYTYPQMVEMMAEWRMEANMARQMQEKAPPKPFADFIFELARYFHEAGIDTGLPSTSDDITAALGADNVAIYTGAVSNTAAAKNKADFMAGRKRVLVATMAKGGTGLSLHDTVGNRPTSQLNINLPWKATGVDQVAARVARYGLRSRAEVTWLFASNIPWERNKLAPRVGARMREMGAIVKGLELKSAEMLDGGFDFEGDVNVKGFSTIETRPEGEDAKGDVYERAQRLERTRRAADNTSGGFFETPFPLAALMANVAGVQPGQRLLEPSAGRGNLLRLLPEGVNVVAVERRADNARILQSNAPAAEVIEADFLAVAGPGGKLEADLIAATRGFTFGDLFRHPDGRLGIMRGHSGERVRFIPEGKTDREAEYVRRSDLVGVEYRARGGGFDTVLMNPPFEREAGIGAQDIEHVQRAYTLLAPGGRLVAVMGEGAFFRSARQDTLFREWLDEHGAVVVQLPEGAFKQSGTMVRTRLVVIDRDARPGRTDLQLADLETESLRDLEALIPARATGSREPPGAQVLLGEEQTVYRVNNPGANYDLFADDLTLQLVPAPSVTPRAPQRVGAKPGSAPAETVAPAVPVVAVRESPTLPGVYLLTDQLVAMRHIDLPVAKVKTMEDAVNALQAIGQFAVEHFDMLVVDKAGKPLAVIGSFKGTVGATFIHPETVIAEAARIKGAARVFAVHNHPSGVETLSDADRNLSRTLADYFAQTGIKYMGIAAVGSGSGRYSYTSADQIDQGDGKVREGPAVVRVPIVERLIRRSSPAVFSMQGSTLAKGVVQAMAGGQAGVFFTDTQYQVTAWVPMAQDQMSLLTKDNRAALLLSSGATANARFAVVSLPGSDIRSRGRDAMAESARKLAASNIANALAKLNVNLLDVVDPDIGVNGPTWDDAGMVPRGQSFATLYDISTKPAPAAEQTPADTAATFTEQIAYTGYPTLPVPRVQATRNLRKLVDRLGKGEITETAFVDAVRVLTDEMATAASARMWNRLGTERKRGPDLVREKLLAARRHEEIDPDGVEFALWALGKNPALAAGLGISVRTPGAMHEGVAGDYKPESEVMRLFKGQDNEQTAVHEILHHAERMMTAPMQARIRRDWARALARAVKTATPEQRDALALIGPAMAGDSAARRDLMQSFRVGILIKDAHYHLVSPSEFWAVNAAGLLWQRFDARDSGYRRVLTWLREMLERVKSLLGLRANGNILRALDSLLNPERNDGEVRSTRMLQEVMPGDTLLDPMTTLVSQRKTVTVDPLMVRVPSMQEAMLDTPDARAALAKNVAVFDAKVQKVGKEELRGYDSIKVEGQTDQERAESIIRQMTRNLLALTSFIPPAVRERMRQWYVGGNRISRAFARRYDMTLMQAAAQLAVLSPQADWFQNVSYGERINDVIDSQQDYTWDEQMTAWADKWIADSQEARDKVAREKAQAVSDQRAKVGRAERDKETLERARDRRRPVLEATLAKSQQALDEAKAAVARARAAADKAAVAEALKLQAKAKGRRDATEKAVRRALRALDVSVSKAETVIRAANRLLQERIESAAEPDANVTVQGRVRGKKLSDLQDDLARAWFVRAYDEVHHPRGYRQISPEGEFLDFALTQSGKQDRLAWKSFAAIAKAISIRLDGSVANVHARLGDEHKVRNFYNNLFDPFAETPFVTVDTHQVAANLLLPLGADQLEVAQNFGGTHTGNVGSTGLSGTYWLYAEAVTRAARIRQILPREMQSISWEAIRFLFPDKFKADAAAVRGVRDLWARYHAGQGGSYEATVRAALSAARPRIGRIVEITPSWVAWRPGSGRAAEDGHSSYEVQLPRGRLGLVQRAGSGPGSDGDAGSPVPAEVAAPRFSRAQPVPGAMRAEAVQSVADRIASRWAQAPEIVVVQSVDDPRVPQAIRAENERQTQGGGFLVPQGVFYKGKVYLFADGQKSITQVAQTLFHEALGHYGLQAVFGPSLDRVLDMVAMARPELIRAKAGQYGKVATLEEARAAVARMRQRSGAEPLTGAALDASAMRLLRKERREVAEEVLAHMAQTQPELGFVRRAVAAIRTWLRENLAGFGDLRLTDDEIIRSYILPARNWVERGRDAGAPEGRMAFQRAARAARAQTETPEFRRWFGNSKVVDADGKPLVVYHGTDKDITQFKVLPVWLAESAAHAGKFVHGGRVASVRAAMGRKAWKKGSAVYPLYASIQNPVDLSRFGEGVILVSLPQVLEAGGIGATPAMVRGVAEEMLASGRVGIADSVADKAADVVENMLSRANVTDLIDNPAVIKLFKAAGFDGYRWSEAGTTTYAAFSAEQVKSATGNRGTYDSADGRVNFARAEPAPVNQMSQADMMLEIARLIPQVEKAYEAGPRSARMAERLDMRLEELMDALESGLVEQEEDQLTAADLLNPLLAAKRRDGEEGDTEADVVRDLANLWREMTGDGFGRQSTQAEQVEMVRGLLDDYAFRHGGLAPGVTDQQMLDAARDAYEAVYGVRARQIERARTKAAAGVDTAQPRPATEAVPMFSRTSVGPTPPPQPGPVQRNRWQALKQRVMNLTSMETWDALRYKFQDRFIDLLRVQERIKALGGTISDLNDMRLGEELFHKRLAVRTERFLTDELRPLLQALKDKGVDLETFEGFLHARHAPEANAAMAKRNPSQDEIDALELQAEDDLKAARLQLQRATAQGGATQALEEAVAQHSERLAEVKRMQAFPGTEDERLSLSGMSDAQAAAVMAGLSPQQRADLDALAAQVDAINTKTVDSLVSYGLIDRQTAAAWRQAYKHYVPLHRDEAHADSKSHPIGQGYNVRGAGVRERVGSNQKVTNILTHIAMQREAALTRGEKNLVLQRLYLLVGQNPMRDFWRIGNPPMNKTIDPVTGTVRRVVDGTYRNEPNVVTLRIAGKDVSIIFERRNPQAERLATAIKSADIGDLGWVSSRVGVGTRWFASVNTQYNPIFGLINMLRDAQSAALNLSTTPLAGKELQVLRGVHHAMRAVYRQERGKGAANPVNAQWVALWNELQEAGGTTGYRDLFSDIEDRAKGLQKEIEALERGQVSRAAHAVVDWLSDYNEAMENAVRVSAYKAALEQGMSKERAASLAKNLTVNFNRKGQKTRDIGAWYAFFNAAVQGTTRMVETLTGPAGRKIMAGGVALGAVNALVGMAFMGGFGDDDEEDHWSRIPDFVKERSLVIPVSSKDYLALPLPLGFNFLPNIGRLAVEFAFGGADKTAGKQLGNLMGVMLDAFNPLGGAQPAAQMAAPTVIDPVVALLENKDWTGRPIYREDRSPLDPQPGTALVKDTASPVGKGIAAAVNAVTGGTKYQPGAWSPTPDQIDYVIGQLTGGLGREISKAVTMAASPVTGDEVPLYKMPLVGRLAGTTRGASGQSEQFYETVKRLNQIENELRGRARNQEDVAGLQAEEPLTQLAGAADRYSRRVSELRQLRRDLNAKEPPGYREEMKRVDEQIEATMRDLNARVRAVQRGVAAAAQ